MFTLQIPLQMLIFNHYKGYGDEDEPKEDFHAGYRGPAEYFQECSFTGIE